MNTSRLSRAAVAIALATGLSGEIRAQLQWSVFNETTTTLAPPASASSGVALTVPAGQRVTLVASNFVPIDWTTATSGEVYVTINFKVSGGLSNIGAGTRAIGFGLYNGNRTPADYSDDSGYFTWLNGRATGSLIELRRRNGNGSSPSLLNPGGTAFVSLGTGTTVQTTGALSDGNNYSIQLHLMARNPGVSLGNTSSTTSGAGVWVSGEGLSQTAFTNPDNPPATLVFNEVGFMFFNSTASDVTLTINSLTGLTPINPPAIAAQPFSAISLNPGQSSTLSVVATGTPPLSYQWRKDSTSIAGATAASFTLANVQSADAGSYSVVVTNAYGTATSNTALVTVTTQPIPATIAGQPASVTVSAGQGASLTVAAFGSSPVSYQWQKNGVAIPGATSPTLALNSVSPADAGVYTVVVGNNAGTATSDPATLVVNAAPVITVQPRGMVASSRVGGNTTFTVVASGTPAPTYQWQRNGVDLAGATAPTLTVNLQVASAGVYTVRVSNEVGAVTSTPVQLAILSEMTPTAFSPAKGATDVNVDTPLRITFDRPAVAGNFGRIQIYKSSDNTLVDTLDMGAPPYRRKIGTQSVDFIFLPIIVSGNTATIYPHAGALAYGETYFVLTEPGTVLDSTGATYGGVGGISDASPRWTFTTKPAGPASSATAVTVAADGSGDFSTVQGAIDWVPLNNTTRRVITVKKGLYNEIVYIGAAKPFITVRGEDRVRTEIAYPNNANFNTLTGNNRAMFNVDANDFRLETITLHNTTPAGGSQAEALRGNASRAVLDRVNLISLQDTLLWNNSLFVTDSYIEGDVDFMWSASGGPAYFQRCELKMMRPGYYTQIRNGQNTVGFVFVDCRLTAAPTLTSGGYLARIDPTPGNFPYSQVVYLNCAMGPHVEAAGWLLNNATRSATIQFWEYKSTDLGGATLDVSKRIPDSRQLTDTEAAQWRDPAFVLGGWTPPGIAPTVELASAPQSVTAGTNARLTAIATGFPAPSLQWFRNGAPIAGATADTLVLPRVQSTDAASYTVTATNASGAAASKPIELTLVRGKYAGTYFGTVDGIGTFSLYVRDDNTGVFLANAAGPSGALAARNVVVEQDRFHGSVGAVVIDGVFAANGTISGSVGPDPRSGLLFPSVSFSGVRAPANGPTQGFSGYVQAGAPGGSTTANLVVGGDGQVFALVQTGSTVEGALGTVDASGRVSVRTASGLMVTTALSSTATPSILVAPPNGAAVSLVGASDAELPNERLREFSARARVDAANAAAIGFVITGDAPEDVLVRAVGPSLGDLFGVAGALANPRIELYRGATVLAGNAGWSVGGGLDVAAAAAQAGAFPLRANVADSAVHVSLAPGAYTAVMSSGGAGAAGIGLMEVYEVSGAATVRLANISLRGAVGTGANVLIAGLAITGSAPKRILIRGAGPALTAFGVTGALARPALSLYRRSQLVAQNSGWTTIPESAAIAAAAREAGAFAFAANSADAALLLHLAPDLYTAQLASADGASGNGLIEIYELP